MVKENNNFFLLSGLVVKFTLVLKSRRLLEKWKIVQLVLEISRFYLFIFYFFLNVYFAGHTKPILSQIIALRKLMFCSIRSGLIIYYLHTDD